MLAVINRHRNSRHAHWIKPKSLAQYASELFFCRCCCYSSMCALMWELWQCHYTQLSFESNQSQSQQTKWKRKEEEEKMRQCLFKVYYFWCFGFSSFFCITQRCFAFFIQQMHAHLFTMFFLNFLSGFFIPKIRKNAADFQYQPSAAMYACIEQMWGKNNDDKNVFGLLHAGRNVTTT